MPNLTFKFIIHHDIAESSGITITETLDLLDVQLISLLGKKRFWTKTLREYFQFETILNILRNFIPPWFINKIKSLIRQKKYNTFKRFRSDRHNSCRNCLLDCLNDSIEASKQNYYCRMTQKLTNAKYSLMSNASKLPSNFTLYTNNWLSAVTFS